MSPVKAALLLALLTSCAKAPVQHTRAPAAAPMPSWYPQPQPYRREPIEVLPDRIPPIQVQPATPTSPPPNP